MDFNYVSEKVGPIGDIFVLKNIVILFCIDF